jgi:xanthine dehydrogenase YagS FAD-binding subunit
MEAFEYASPKSKEEAIKLLAGEWGKTEVLAGGTDLLSLIKDGAAHPGRLVSLKAVEGLGGIEYKDDSGLSLGALVTIDELVSNDDVRAHYPALADAADGIRSPQIRSLGTVGGELCQRPRCWYYRAGFGLLATYNGKALVPEGDNRYHAILGNAGPAYFVNPSSLAPVLIALGAKLSIQGPQGSRQVGVDKFFSTPSAEGQREYDLKPNEILTGISVPPAGATKMAIYEVRQKEALDWPLAAAVVVLTMDGETVKSARVVLGHVAPVPWPSPEAEAALAGKTVSEAVAEAAGQAAVGKAKPLSMNGYKVQLARVAVKRAILKAAQGGA